MTELEQGSMNIELKRHIQYLLTRELQNRQDTLLRARLQHEDEAVIADYQHDVEFSQRALAEFKGSNVADRAVL